MRNSKTLICTIIITTMLACLFNFGPVFADENDVSSVDSTDIFEETINTEYAETVETKADEDSFENDEATLYEGVFDSKNKEEEMQSVEAEPTPSNDVDSSDFAYDAYDIKQLDSGEYIAYNIAVRDVEVYVTDGYSPVQGAVVNIADKTKVTDADGMVTFEAIPTSDEEYTITAEYGAFGQRTYDITLLGSQTLESTEQEIETSKYTISFWTPEYDATAEEQAAETFSLSENSVNSVSVASDTNDGWTYDYNAPIKVKKVFECNGYIYVFGETNKAYNISTGTWATLSSEPQTDADNTVFCNGKIYTYFYAFYPSGDTYSYYYKIRSFDLSTGNTTTLLYDTSGGYNYSSAIECGGKIYFAGGYGIEYDTGASETNENVDVYDPVTNTLSTVCSTGTCDIIETVTYDDTYIYYFSNESTGTAIDRVNITTSNSEYVNITENYIAYDGEAVCATAGKVYFIGGDEADDTMRVYDFVTGTYSAYQYAEASRVLPSVEFYDNKLYIIGGFYLPSGVDNISIYDLASETWQSDSYGDNITSCAKSVICDDKLYVLSYDDGVMGIYDLLYQDSESEIIENKVSAGTNHVVCIKNGEVYTYGDNTYGQLGTGDNESYNEFVKALAPWGNKKIVKVSTKGDTTFVLTEDSILYGFGRNDKYQLGIGTNANKNTPVQIMTDVSDVAAGLEHTIVLKTNGDVYGFGNNTYKQINSTSSTVITTPYKIASGASLIAAGDYHTFYNDSAKTLHGLGRNDYYQVGYPDEVPAPVQVECGSNHTVAIGSNGIMYVWGSNSNGQFPVALSNSATYTEHPYNTGIYVDKIAAGGNYTAFVDDHLHICGNKKFTDTLYDTIEGINDINDIEDIAVGTRYCIAIDVLENVWRFGYMTSNPALISGGTYVPCKIDYDYKILQIDSYRTQTLAINELGQVLAWGEGYYADGTDKMTTKTYPTVISGISNPIQVSRGKNHNLVLNKNGDVYGWGSNSNYPMGNLGGKVKTVTKLDNISNVKQIAAGTEFSLFLKNDGTLWGVGKNDYGQLGQGDTETRSTPVQITDKTDFIKISVGEVYSAAIASDGIYVWGGNPLGQLGNGTLNIRNLTPKKLEVSLENNEYFVDISAGIDFCLALTSLGNVYSWGDNANGQLAISVANPRKPLKIETLSNISKISAGYKSALAVKDDGTVYGWGYGYDGQLGFSAGSEYTPIEVTTLGNTNIKNISCGYDFSVALDYDGNIYTFGNNTSGQLGVYISEVKRLDVSTIITDVVIEGTDGEETASYSISAEAGEEYVICFLASEDGTYSIDTSDMTAGTVVMVYRDENFTTPYKQTSAGDTITVGVEAGSTAYIRFVNTNQISYNANIAITKTSAVVEDNKTYYMVLYDSYCGVSDGLWPRYYGTNVDQKFEYTKEFFVNYLKLFSNKKVAFAISLRDLDFDCEPVSNSDIGNDAPSLNYNEILEKNLIQKVVDGCESYYRKIIHNIVNAYNSLETNERPNEFPALYIGTPHFNAYAISDADKWTFAGAYLSAMNDIYNKLTTEYSDDLSSINETFIKGLYFGRENPDMREYGSPERICLEYISNYIHSKNKKLLWIPFTLGKPSSLSYIGKMANSGCYNASDGTTKDLFDIIAIQPGLYFYEVNSSTTDEEFTQTLDDLVMCLNSSQNAVYSNGSIVDGQKITNTNVTVEIEYDISLITGRRVEGSIRSTVTNKINRFLIIKDTFNDYINDAYTPICIYAGGPNEQNFVYSPGANANNYRHSDRNHLTLWCDGHMQPYSEFSSHLSDYESSENSYSGDLIYDITNGTINRVWSDSIIKFLGRSNL